MPRDGKTAITISTDLRDTLNQARKDRGQTWNTYLRDAALALEKQGNLDEVTLTEGAITDLTSRLAPEIVDRLRRS